MKTIRTASALLVLLLALPAAFPQSGGYGDDDLQAKISQRLSQDPVLTDDQLSVSVSGGVATVSGTVDTLWEAWNVRENVSAISGVVEYQAQLSLADQDVPDSSLTTAVADALRRNLLDSPQVGTITASAQGGAVTLGGTIRDARKRFDARAAVAKVRGVQRIDDQLRSPDSPDDAIQKAVTVILAGGTGIPVGSKIKVDVSDGIVTLSGTVAVLSARWQAAESAWGVNGVRGVENKITVVPPSTGVKTLRP
jgi:osmotically-inducible protein OsmY